MTQTPREGDTPFSLPDDVPEAMPIDYPSLDEGVDSHEAYDEGRDDVIDVDPYRDDDTPVAAPRRLMREGSAGQEYYTADHDAIRQWASHRGGYPAKIIGEARRLPADGLYIAFRDQEPDVATRSLSWEAFFTIFDAYDVVFLYRLRNRSGSQSRFYTFVSLADVNRTTQAKRAP